MSAKHYTVNLDVKPHRNAGSTTPLRVEIDFDDFIPKATTGAMVDPHTLAVTRRLDGKTQRYEVQFSETLYTSSTGWVAWLADDPQCGGDWTLEFALRDSSGDMAKPPYMPMVGVGDEIRYNSGQWQPIGVPGMHQFPIPVDFDGDGLVDIVSSSHYSNTQGMPWSGVFFWKNIGTNARPRFAPPRRVHADGVDRTDSSKTHWQFGQIWLFHNQGKSGGQWQFKTSPLLTSSFWKPTVARKDWETLNNFPHGRPCHIDWFDVDGDGNKEMLMLHGKPRPMIEIWRNAGTQDDPRMIVDGKMPWSEDYCSYGFRFARNAAFDGCLCAKINSGAGIHYFKRVKDDPCDPKAYRDMGPLLGQAEKVRVEGYVRPVPVDLGNTGTMDLVCGDEVGFISVIRNTGTPRICK